MSTGKTLMTKKIKSLKNAIEDFKDLQLMVLPSKDMQGAAKEGVECRNAAKEAYNRI